MMYNEPSVNIHSEAAGITPRYYVASYTFQLKNPYYILCNIYQFGRLYIQ